MIRDKEKALYKAALITFGDKNQLTVATEELSELQQQICKVVRGAMDRKHLIEEMADVCICIEQVMQILNISRSDLQVAKNRKQKRLVKIIAEAQSIGVEEAMEWINFIGSE